MRELIVFLFLLSVFSALAGAYFSFMASTSSHEAKRKSYAALKSQANAMTFIFLSGLILSQSLILASNFTAPGVPDSSVTGTRAGLDASDAAGNAGDVGAAAPEATALDSGENHAESPTASPPEEAGAISPSETVGENTNIPAGNDTAAPSGDAGTAVSEPQIVLPGNGTEISTPPVLPEPAQNESINAGNSGDAEKLAQNDTAPENGSADIVLNISEILPPAPEIDANATEPGPPALEMRLNVSENIKRGDAFSLLAEITNTGASGAKNVAVDFTMPEGVSFVSGEKSIGEIHAGETIRRKFIFHASYGAALGARKIKVRMTYD